MYVVEELQSRADRFDNLAAASRREIARLRAVVQPSARTEDELALHMADAQRHAAWAARLRRWVDVY